MKGEGILSFGGFNHRYARKLDLSKNPLQQERVIVSLNQSKAGQQGK
jgi:hypothetical protein